MCVTIIKGGVIGKTTLSQTGKLYAVGACVTVNKQLRKFSKWCSFTQYMPNKIDKHGLKLFLL